DLGIIMGTTSRRGRPCQGRPCSRNTDRPRTARRLEANEGERPRTAETKYRSTRTRSVKRPSTDAAAVTLAFGTTNRPAIAIAYRDAGRQENDGVLPARVADVGVDGDQ